MAAWLFLSQASANSDQLAGGAMDQENHGETLNSGVLNNLITMDTHLFNELIAEDG